MDLDSVFDPFANAIANVTLFQRVAGAMVRTEVEALQSFKSQVDARPEEEKEIFNSFHAILFPDPRTWEHKIFHRFNLTIEDRLRNVVKHKHKQYQWLFAEAFEAYEKFVDRAYAYAAVKNPDIWPMSDYGNIAMSEVPGLDFEWLYAQAVKKNNRPDALLKQLRKRLPTFAVEEESGKSPASFKLAISLSEQIRHHVVHTAGRVSDVAAFTEKVLKRIGATNNGNPHEKDSRFIELFLETTGTETQIGLIEVKFANDMPFMQYNRFDLLVGYLMAHGVLIRDHLARL